MLTDAEARDLLRAAAETIEVAPAEPLPAVHRPHLWPMLVAAAAVVAVVATTLVLADRGAQPDPSSPSPSPSPSPAVNRIPPVMGLDLEDALDRLTDLDLHVELVNKEDCVNQRVVAGSTPSVGARFRPEDTVQLTVVNPTMGFCVDPAPDAAWDLLRFALGVAPAPNFADTVTLYPGGGEPVVLTADEAQDPENWEVCDGDVCGSALTMLATAAAQPRAILESVELKRDFDADPCMGGAAIGTDIGAYYGITIAPPMDGIRICPQLTAQYSREGLLEAVAIPLRADRAADDQPPSAEAASAADAFVAWARGSSRPPAFTDEVRYLVNDGLVRTMSAERAARPESWRVCFSGVPLGCPSLVTTLERYDGTVVQTSTPAVSCVRRTGRLPDDLTRLELVRLDPPEAKNCSAAFAVELFVDDGGRIAAINQLPGSAAPPAS